MLFRKRKEKKEEIRRGIQIGDRFAIQYGCISTPLYTEEEHPYTSATIKVNYHELRHCSPDLDMDHLWTVVEYIGEGKYMDLVTGEIFTGQVDADTIEDTVTQEYEEEALAKQSELLEFPLAFGSGRMFGTGRTELTTEIKQKIMQETMPKSDLIGAELEEWKKESREVITHLYDRKNKAKMHRLYNEAQEEERKRQEEARKQAELEERRRQEEERRLAAEQLRAMVDPKFDEMFPADKSKRLFRK